MGFITFWSAMPYATARAGVYRLVNRVEHLAYVGSSSNLQKRRAEHFRLLRLGAHPNARLQAAFFCYGEAAFDWVEEVDCADLADARELELLILRGELQFEEGPGYNLAVDAFPMLGRTHTAHTRQRIAATKRAAARPLSPVETQAAEQAQRTRRLADSEHASRVRYVVENAHLTYAERARAIGVTTSTARKMYLRYAPSYGKVLAPARPSYDRGVAGKVEYIKARPGMTIKALAIDLACSATSVSTLIRRYKLR